MRENCENKTLKIQSLVFQFCPDSKIGQKEKVALNTNVLMEINFIRKSYVVLH